MFRSPRCTVADQARRVCALEPRSDGVLSHRGRVRVSSSRVGVCVEDLQSRHTEKQTLLSRVSIAFTTHTHSLSRTCVCVLTLVSRTLACSPRLDLKLLLAELLQRSKCDLRARFLSHRWQQLRVAHRFVSTIRGEDGCTHVTADLRRCEYAWSARRRCVLE